MATAIKIHKNTIARSWLYTYSFADDGRGDVEVFDDEPSRVALANS